jgi:pyruvate dehydrogenase E2 component (dihydrolipoamide acetyltransferase)
MMANEITLPRLGWDMTEGVLSSWLKKEKEYVNAGEPLFSVEGDKAVQEIEALDSGYLVLLPGGPQPGDKLPVGTLLGYLVAEEELATFKPPIESQPEIVSQAAESKPAAEVASARKTSEVHSGNGRSQRVYISPYAKRLAESLGIDWHTIQGSGLRGRIMAKDVEASAARLKAAPSALVPGAAPVIQPVVPVAAPQPALSASRLPMAPIRRKIAEHMAYSAHTSAPVTLTAEVDATELVNLRKTLKTDAEKTGLPFPSYNDILAKLCAQAITEHPLVNARIEGDEIVQLASVNVAIAVDTERGLIVPVLHDVQSKTLRQLARESALLIEKTRNGTIGYEELQGATFTITNLGMFEIDAFTPIIDLPQCAILGVGQIVPKQVVIDAEAGKVAIRQRMVLSLTFDHRLIDGAQAARFLQRVKHFVENPYLWLVG